MNGHQPTDTRPQLCRNCLRDEGQAYPRSGCAVCGNGGMMGCPHERRPTPPTTGSGVMLPKPVDAGLVTAREALGYFARLDAMNPPEGVPLKEWLPAVTAARAALRAALAPNSTEGRSDRA